MRLISLLFLLFLAVPCPGVAATLPAGFTETQVASGLASPTAGQFAPDGRLFICEQGGRLRVVKDGALLPTPFLTVTVSSSGERGLLGVAFDPAFATNHSQDYFFADLDPGARSERRTANAPPRTSEAAGS